MAIVAKLAGVVLCQLVRLLAAHNTSAALGYIVKPEAFAGLTDAQRKQVHRGACNLMGLKDTATVAELQAAAVAAHNAGRNPRFSWVHQRFNPYPTPGATRLKSLSTLYEAAAASGYITPVGGVVPDFVTACKAAVESKEIQQQPRKGGYILAVTVDVEAAKKERADAPKSAKVTDVAMVAALLG